MSFENNNEIRSDQIRYDKIRHKIRVLKTTMRSDQIRCDKIKIRQDKI
jgi:hypothetical protein